MKVRIIRSSFGQAEYLAKPETLHLGGVGTAGVEKLEFVLPPEWEGMAVTLHVRQEGGGLPQPVLLDGENSAEVDKRFTAVRRGIWMLLAMDGAGYTAMTRPGKYDCYETVELDATLEDLPPSVYEQFVALVQEYSNRAKDAENAAAVSVENARAAADLAGESKDGAMRANLAAQEAIARTTTAGQLTLANANAAAAAAARADEREKQARRACVAAVKAANRALGMTMPPEEKRLILRLFANATYATTEGAELYTALADAWTEVPVESVELSDTFLQMNEGEQLAIAATIRPADATDQKLIWESSAPDVASVEDGVVTACGKGSVRIAARAGGASADCVVVVQKAVERVELSHSGLALTTGQSAALAALVLPEGSGDGVVVWKTSNAAIVTVSGGVVTATGEGSAVVTAAAGGVSGHCVVTVSAAVIPVERVELGETALELKTGESIRLEATVSPPEATSREVSWRSEDRAVADVVDGYVAALTEGTARITATAGGVTASCAVTVKKAFTAVEEIALDRSNMELVVGQMGRLTATITPGTATETAVWTSSDPDTVSVEDGELTAKQEGVALIRATAGGKTASCTVTVAAAVIPVERVSLDASVLSLTEGGTARLTATVKPDDATDKTVNWSTDNNRVASVANGIVTAKEAGSAHITATAGGKTTSCTVNVAAAVVYYAVTNRLTRVKTSQTAVVYKAGEAYSAVLTAESGKTLRAVTVTMGGRNITAEAWNAQRRTVTIAAVTGNVLIVANAE